MQHKQVPRAQIFYIFFLVKNVFFFLSVFVLGIQGARSEVPRGAKNPNSQETQLPGDSGGRGEVEGYVFFVIFRRAICDGDVTSMEGSPAEQRTGDENFG